MDSSNFPQTPVDAANPSSTPLPLDSSTLPSSTQQQASLQSTATTTDVVIDYDEAEEEIRQFMAVRLLFLLLFTLLSLSPLRTGIPQWLPTVGRAPG